MTANNPLWLIVYALVLTIVFLAGVRYGQEDTEDRFCQFRQEPGIRQEVCER